MSWYKIKSDETMRLYSIYRRMLSGGICTFQVTPKCINRRGVWDWKHEMELSHFHSRRQYSVRHSDSNTDPSCKMCHKWMDSHQTEHEVFKLEQLGQRKFDKLLVAAQVKVKKFIQEIEKKVFRKWLREKIKELEDK